MYSEKVMDHFQHPRNVGEIENASGIGTVGNAKCGDIMRIYLDIDDNGIIKDCKFKTFGCGAAVATSSMATEMVMGKSIQEALQVTNKAVMEALDGLPPVKVHCSLLAEEAIHAALWDYAEKHGIKIEGLKKPKSDIHEGEEAEEEEYYKSKPRRQLSAGLFLFKRFPPDKKRASAPQIPYNSGNHIPLREPEFSQNPRPAAPEHGRHSRW